VGGAALVAAFPVLLVGWAVSEYLWELWWLDAGSSGLLDGVPDGPVVVRALVGLVLLVVVGSVLSGPEQPPFVPFT